MSSGTAGKNDLRTMNHPVQGTALSWLAIVISVGIYGAHFLFGGGTIHLILDSAAYLGVASGEGSGVPFDTRVFAPSVAVLIAKLSGVSIPTAFQLLTPPALFGSLLILRRCIKRRGGSEEWQA